MLPDYPENSYEKHVVVEGLAAMCTHHGLFTFDPRYIDPASE